VKQYSLSERLNESLCVLQGQQTGKGDDFSISRFMLIMPVTNPQMRVYCYHYHPCCSYDNNDVRFSSLLCKWQQRAAIANKEPVSHSLTPSVVFAFQLAGSGPAGFQIGVDLFQRKNVATSALLLCKFLTVSQPCLHKYGFEKETGSVTVLFVQIQKWRYKFSAGVTGVEAWELASGRVFSTQFLEMQFLRFCFDLVLGNFTGINCRVVLNASVPVE
jgi:hypothetical protein